MGGSKLAILLVAFLAHNVISQEDPRILATNANGEFSSAQSQSGSDFDDLEKALAIQFAKANIPSENPEPIDFSVNITPPPNSGMEFVTKFQETLSKIAKENAPLASTSFGFAVTKNGNGDVTNLQVNISITPPKMVTPTLPPSTLPEIDLRQSTGQLPGDLERIVFTTLLKNGYVPDSSKVQNFNLEFNVLPPEGATKDYVELYVVKPLQQAVRNILPYGFVNSLSVKTFENNGEILRQTVMANIRVEPPTQFIFSKHTINVPVIDVSKTTNINVILQQIITEENTKDRTIAIPFKVQVTNKQEEDNYVKYIEGVLKTIDPNTQILKVIKENTSTGDVIFTVYVYLNGQSEITKITASPIINIIPITQPTTTSTTQKTTTTQKPTTTTQKPTTTTQKPTTTTRKPTTTTRKPTTTTPKPTTTTRRATTTAIRKFIARVTVRRVVQQPVRRVVQPVRRVVQPVRRVVQPVRRVVQPVRRVVQPVRRVVQPVRRVVVRRRG